MNPSGSVTFFRFGISYLSLIPASVESKRIPESWTDEACSRTPFQHVNLQKPGGSTVVGRWPRSEDLSTTLKVCTSEDGIHLAPDWCVQRALSLAFSFSLAHSNRKSVNSTGKRHGEQAKEFVARISKDATINSIKVNSDELVSNKIDCRSVAGLASDIDVRYSGPRPITFLLHDEVGRSKLSASTPRPHFLATDGVQFHIALLTDPQKARRSDREVSPHVRFEPGRGLTVQTDFEPVATWHHV